MSIVMKFLGEKWKLKKAENMLMNIKFIKKGLKAVEKKIKEEGLSDEKYDDEIRKAKRKLERME